MKKRAIILGYPAFVMWRSVLAGVLLVIVLCAVLVGLLLGVISGLLSSMGPASSNAQSVSFFPVYWLVVLGVFLVWWWVSRGSRRFARRFKKLSGRVCLVCGYEIDNQIDNQIEAGSNECGRCGAPWSLDGLNKRWRKLAGHHRRKNERG